MNRFQRVAGLARAVALASSAFTALIPLAIVAGKHPASSRGQNRRAADHRRLRPDGRQGRSGEGRALAAAGTETNVTVAGALLIVVAVLSFTRGTQRLFEQTWELKPLSVRNTFNGLLWIAGLTAYLTVSGWVHGVQDQSRLQIGGSLSASEAGVWSALAETTRRHAFVAASRRSPGWSSSVSSAFS